jgi:hypothetical protein
MSCSCAQQAQATMCGLIDCKRIMLMNNARRGIFCTQSSQSVGRTHTQKQSAIAHTGYGSHTPKGRVHQQTACVLGGHTGHKHTTRKQLTTTATPLPMCVRPADLQEAARTPRVSHGSAPAHHPWVSLQKQRAWANALAWSGNNVTCQVAAKAKHHTLANHLKAAASHGMHRWQQREQQAVHALSCGHNWGHAHTRSRPAL